MTLIILLLLGIFLGLVAGFLPGIGNVVILLSLYPLLTQYSPEYVILFYAVLIQTSNFSSSVSAINLGLLGDITSEPALRERVFLIKNNLIKKSLQFTAISSVYACMISLFLFYLIIDWISGNPVILRTEIRFIVLWVITVAVIFWPKNNCVENFTLLISGMILTVVGHYEHFLGTQDIQILTFGLTSLHGGIPTIAVLTAFLAVPALLKLHKTSLITFEITQAEKKQSSEKFSWSSGTRGSLIGSVLGLVPMVGAIVSSNVACAVEKMFLKSKSENQQSLNRLTSAEAANNSANVTVLIPMLIFGLAIIPSELILLSIIETRGWTPNLTMSFYYSLFLAILFSCFVSYLVCYTFVSSLTRIIRNQLFVISFITITLMITSIWYSGWLVDNRTLYLSTFVIFSVIVILFRKIDYMPLVVGFLLGDQLLGVSSVFYRLYF
jgi:putative tricarboxylic transport membrane protein